MYHKPAWEELKRFIQAKQYLNDGDSKLINEIMNEIYHLECRHRR